MAFGLLSVGAGYGQFGFIGTSGIILADASTLTVNSSGASTQTLVNGSVGGMVNSDTFLGVSPPNVAGGYAFGFMYQNGTFSTFALPVSLDDTYVFNLFEQEGNITDLWVAAKSPSENGAGYPYLLNLSVIAGITTGTGIIDTNGPGYWDYTQPGEYFLSGSFLCGSQLNGNALSVYDISTGSFTQINAPLILSSTPACTVFGANFAYVDSTSDIVLSNLAGTTQLVISSTSFSSIATLSPLLYNYLGTLMYVNPALNLACSMNLNTGYVSPIFPFNINPNSGTVAYNSFDQQTGIMYLNTGGSSPNTFGNLTPMLLT